MRKATSLGLEFKHPASPNNWDFISLLFSGTFCSHFNLTDGECNNTSTREAEALTGSHADASSEGKESKKRQDRPDS